MYKLTPYASVTRLSDGAAIPMSLDNSDYVAYLAWLAAGNVPEPVSAPSTADQIAANEAAIQEVLDTTAQSRGYTDIKSACAYAATAPVAPTTNPHFAICEKFRQEGNALQAWMFLTWATAYAYLATVNAGTNPMPTKDQAIAMIPPFTWPD